MNKILLDTPIQKLNNGINQNNIYIKRDDLIPFSFGGNKVRKAILFFEKILKSEYNHVVTYGSSSSNHCRIIANMAKVNNIPCTIISLENDKETFNSIFVRKFGAHVILTDVNNVKSTIDNTMNDLRIKKNNPFFIPGGGHGDLGTEAYVVAYREILKYELEKSVSFDYIFFASGTGSTQSGLVCGSILNCDKKKIIGISVGRKKEVGRKVIEDSVASYLQIKNISIEEAEDKIIFLDEFLLDGYGHYNVEIEETVTTLMENEGVPLDRTYTGKAFWGMSEYLENNKIANKNVLFIHTGGTPLYFSDLKGNL